MRVSAIIAIKELEESGFVETIESIDSFVGEIIVSCSSKGVCDQVIKLPQVRSRPKVRVIAQTGSGIANAWNDAVSCSNGQLLTFFGQGDRASRAWGEFVVNHAHYRLDRYNEVTVFSISRDGIRLFPAFSNRLLFVIWTKIMFLFAEPGFSHPGSLWSRNLILELGGFDSTFQIALDNHMWWSAKRSGACLKFVASEILMSPGGISQTRWHKGECENLRSFFLNFRVFAIFAIPEILSKICFKWTRRKFRSNLG